MTTYSLLNNGPSVHVFFAINAPKNASPPSDSNDRIGRLVYAIGMLRLTSIRSNCHMRMLRRNRNYAHNEKVDDHTS